MSKTYVAVESFVIMGRPLKNILRFQVIDPCFMMNKNCKEEAPKKFSLKNFTKMNQQ